MPIPFEQLLFKQLLHHELAYECIDTAGKELVPHWDMIAFEKAVFSDELHTFPLLEEQLRLLKEACRELDHKMPYLRYSEDGTHYGYELFSYPPDCWMSRGAPLFWAYLSREFTIDSLPMDDTMLQQKYLAIAKAFEIPRYRNRKVYIVRFVAGGMSSGVVCSDFVNEQLQVLRKRNRPFTSRHNYPVSKIPYLEGAQKRIDYLCENSATKTGYRYNRDLDYDTLLFILESNCTPREFEIITLKWGLFTGKLLRNKEAAGLVGVTYNRIPQIEQAAFRKIANNPQLLEPIRKIT